MSSDNYYTITGLLSNTKYFIVLTPHGQNYQCAGGGSTSYSAISETLTSGEVNHVYPNSIHVLSEACRHLCTAYRYTLYGSREGSRIPLGKEKNKNFLEKQ